MIAKVLLKKLHPDAVVPKYATPGSSGVDVCALYSNIIEPGHWKAIETGLSMEIQPGFECQVRPRSGLALKQGISVLNSPGSIDSDYRGEIKVILINNGISDFEIRAGDRIAQLVFAPVAQASFVVSDVLSDTQRGDGGFGSTGI
jgi:dUTP pyrophosphatase